MATHKIIKSKHHIASKMSERMPEHDMEHEWNYVLKVMYEIY